MRALVLTVGSLLGGGFVLLGCLVLVMGEALVPTRSVDIQAFGMAAYAMGIGWVGLGTSLFCIGLLGAELGAKYYVRMVRDAAFLVFGAGLVAALVLAAMRFYGNIRL